MTQKSLLAKTRSQLSRGGQEGARSRKMIPSSNSVALVNAMQLFDELLDSQRWGVPPLQPERTGRRYYYTAASVGSALHSAIRAVCEGRGLRQETTATMQKSLVRSENANRSRGAGRFKPSSTGTTRVSNSTASPVGGLLKPVAEAFSVVHRKLGITLIYSEPLEGTFHMSLSLCRSELEVLCDFDDRFLTRFSLHDQLNHLRHVHDWTAETFVQHAKYHLACPMAACLGNSPPDRPETFKGSPLVWTGNVKRYLKCHMRGIRGRALALNWSFLQGIKRGCDSVDKIVVEAAYAKHAKALSRSPVTSQEDIALNYGNYVDRLLSSLSKPCRVEPTFGEPSHNSCFERTMKNGGQYCEVLAQIHPGSEAGVATKHNVFGEYVPPLLDEPCPSFPLNPLRDVFGQHLEYPYFPLPTSDHVRNVCENRLDSMMADWSMGRVSVVAILEPLKVRMISKGEALPAYYARYFQQAMKHDLDLLPQLVLTTRPLSVTDLHDILAREASLSLHGKSIWGNDLPDWVSGDYSAATDGLNINFTKLTFESFCDKFKATEQERTLLRRNLYEQVLHYPDEKTSPRGRVTSSQGDSPPSKYPKRVVQRNGQLMGSILSFPILCAINLICYWRAMERYLGRSVSVETLPVLVNGDDILFRATQALYAFWKEELVKAEFTLSPGKNYVHRTVLTINSTCFIHNQTSNSFKRVPFLNVGLLQGKSKSNTFREEMPLWDIFNKVTAECINPVRATARFLHHHADRIQRLTLGGELNLFLPRELGGLGFTKPAHWKSYYTNFQRLFASYRASIMPRHWYDLSSGSALQESYTIKRTCGPHFKSIPVITFRDKNKTRVMPVATYNKGISSLRPMYGPYWPGDYASRDFKSPTIPLSTPLNGLTKVMVYSGMPKQHLRDFRAATGYTILTDTKLDDFQYTQSSLTTYLPLSANQIVAPSPFLGPYAATVSKFSTRGVYLNYRALDLSTRLPKIERTDSAGINPRHDDYPDEISGSKIRHDQ